MPIVAADTAMAQMPAAIAAPDAKPIVTLHAEGAQIYQCKAGSDGKLAWSFREPIATLIADGQTVGRHYAGPNWEYTDGSVVTGKVAGSAPGATKNDAPGLSSTWSGGAAAACSAPPPLCSASTPQAARLRAIAIMPAPCAAFPIPRITFFCASGRLTGGRAGLAAQAPPAYLVFMPKRKLNALATAAIIVPLLALLAAALWFAAGAWVSLERPADAGRAAIIAMVLGIVFSLIIGCGLMALVFYSSRHGYDEPYRADGDEPRLKGGQRSRSNTSNRPIANKQLL